MLSWAVASLTLASLAPPAIAAPTCTINWTGEQSSAWHDPLNWSAEDSVPRAPAPADDVCIEAEKNLPVDHSFGVDTVASLHVGAVTPPLGSLGALVLSGGVLRLAGDSTSQAAVAVMNGALELNASLDVKGVAWRGGDILGGHLRAEYVAIGPSAPGRSMVDTQATVATWYAGLDDMDITLAGTANLRVTAGYYTAGGSLRYAPGASGGIVVPRGARIETCASSSAAIVEPPIQVDGLVMLKCGSLRLDRLSNLTALPGGGQRLVGGGWYVDGGGLVVRGGDIRELAVGALQLHSPSTTLTDEIGQEALRNLHLVDGGFIQLLSRLTVESALEVRAEDLLIWPQGSIDSGSTITLNSRYTELEGTLRPGHGEGVVEIVGTSGVSCTGIIEGSLSNRGWMVVEPGFFGLPNHGCRVRGDYVASSTADTWFMYTRDDGRLRFGPLEVTGTAALNGRLGFTPVLGVEQRYVPEAGETFELVRAAAVTGRHSSVYEKQAIPGRRFRPTYSDQALHAVVESSPAPVTDLAAAPGRGNATLTWQNPEHYYSCVDITTAVGESAGRLEDAQHSACPPLAAHTIGGLKQGTTYTFTLWTRYYDRADEPVFHWYPVYGPPVSVTLRGSAVAATASPSTVRPRRQVVISGSLTDAGSGSGLPDRSVALQRRATTSEPWITVASRLTDETGSVVFRRRPATTLRFRLVFTGAGDHLGSRSAGQVVRVTR